MSIDMAEIALGTLKKIADNGDEVKNNKKMSNGLTIRQNLFCEYYITNGGDEVKAFLDAGYKNPPTKKRLKQMAKEMLQEEVIGNYILETMKKRMMVGNVRAEDFLAELINIATFNIKDVAEWNHDTVNIKSSEDIPDHVAACIKSINQVKIAGGHKTVKMELYDKTKALDTLTKLLGMQKETILHRHVIQAEEDTYDEKAVKLSLQKAGLLATGKTFKPANEFENISEIDKSKIIEADVVVEYGNLEDDEE